MTIKNKIASLGGLLICSSLLLLSSCFPKDDRVNPPAGYGSSKVVVLPLESDYKYQCWFDFSSGSMVAQNLRSDADLLFECRSDRSLVWLNTARGMGAAHAGLVDFTSLTDTSGLSFRHDSPTGNADTTAIGNWYTGNSSPVSLGHVYVVDRGYDYTNTFSGFRKIQFINNSDGSIRMHYAALDGSDDHYVDIVKDFDYNFSYFSFDDGGHWVQPEPLKTDYDFVATQYTELIPDPTGTESGIYPYQVTGCVINPYGVSVAVDLNNSYDKIDAVMASSMEYYHNLNIIGYGWKHYDFSSASYTVFPELSFVLKDAAGNMFKLRFLDFYNDSGEKGYIKFEYQAL